MRYPTDMPSSRRRAQAFERCTIGRTAHAYVLTELEGGLRAAVFEGDGQLVVRDVPDAAISVPTDVLIQVEACGICGSDLHMLAVPPTHPGTPGTIMGHEFVGRIVEVGSAAQGVAVGDRVVVDPDPKCGYCQWCRAGRPSDCLNIVALGHHRHGGLAELTTAPSSAVYPISDGVAAELAAMTEPIACVLNGIYQASPRAGDCAVVFGAGPIGCYFVAILRASGVGPIIVVEPADQRHPIAYLAGATAVVPPGSLKACLDELVPSGASIVVDAVGTVLPEAIDVAGQGGKIILFGMNDDARPSVPHVEIIRKGLTITSSFITDFTFPPAVRLVESGILPLGEILTGVLPLDETPVAFDRLRAREAGKLVIKP